MKPHPIFDQKEMTQLQSLQQSLSYRAFINSPVEVRDDLELALKWARKTLRKHEGAGHVFQLHSCKGEMFQCSVAKPEWLGDHVSRTMSEAPHAVVMAVCEYLNGE
tara:strand:- start:2093 stop:2410 length:318 start_codon:yes stop_codon:yes gene_type:complete